MHKRTIRVLIMMILAVVLLCVGCGRQTQAGPAPDVDPEPVAEVLPEPEAEPEPEPKPEPKPQAVFPAGTVLCGVDVSGLTGRRAETAVRRAIAEYTVTVAINGTEKAFTGKELGISLDMKALRTYLNRTVSGAMDTPTLVQVDESAVERELSSFPNLEGTAKNARLQYNSATASFELVKEQNGYGIDVTPAIDAVALALPGMQERVDLTLEEAEYSPRITIGSPEAQRALSAANALLGVSLSYTFQPDGITKGTETLSASEIGNMLYVKDDGLSVGVSYDRAYQYATTMSSRYSESQDRTYAASGGKSTRTEVNVSAMADDLVYCISNGVSGMRSAPFRTVEVSSAPAGDYGDTYVDIDLSAQHLWVYSGGVCVVSTDIVSGCVATGCATPTGVYKIHHKSQGTYLSGPSWYTYVDYWMPFNGGIGLHDASWRSEFGGTIYQNSGSHGCINMPKWAAAETFQYVQAGTTVIVRAGSGSSTSVPDEPTYTPSDPPSYVTDPTPYEPLPYEPTPGFDPTQEFEQTPEFDPTPVFDPTPIFDPTPYAPVPYDPSQYTPTPVFDPTQ